MIISKINFFNFKLIFLVFMNSFDVLISKIFFNIISNKKYFKKQLLQSSKKYIYKRKKNIIVIKRL
jgi:hypothetical protein